MIYEQNKINIRYFKTNFKYKIIIRLLYVIDCIDYIYIIIVHIVYINYNI